MLEDDNTNSYESNLSINSDDELNINYDDEGTKSKIEVKYNTDN